MTTKRKLAWAAIASTIVVTVALLVLGGVSSAQSNAIFPAEVATTGIEFKGQMNFDVEFLETGFRSEFPPCPARAALIQIDKEQYELRLMEDGPCGGRMSIWDLTIDKEGNVSGEAWAQVLHPPVEEGSMMGQFWIHSGCMMIGNDPLFPGITGTWDGTKLIADTHFEGHCESGTMWGGAELWSMTADIENDNEGRLADGVSWEDGVVHTRFGAELTIVE